MSQQNLLFEPRISPHAQIKKNTKNITSHHPVAIVELIANAWDAGATEVDITWPTQEICFVIKDNGQGMTKEEFKNQWAHIWYSRTNNNQSDVTITLPDGTERKRKSFGRNGLGKFAVFCFSSEIEVVTTKNNTQETFHVTESSEKPLFNCEHKKTVEQKQSGTMIRALVPQNTYFTPEEIISYLSQRFVALPHFEITVNGNKISLESIPESCIAGNQLIIVEGIGEIKITVIEKKEKDSTIRWAGIAWVIQSRFIGEASWCILNYPAIDGRTTEGKQLIFLVESDGLIPNADWTGLDSENLNNIHACEQIYNSINEIIFKNTYEKRADRAKEVKYRNSNIRNALNIVSRSKIDKFVEEVINNCPTIKNNDLDYLVQILSTIEMTTGKYEILRKLSNLKPEEWEQIGKIISDWSIEVAKVVLDEIENRMDLINQLTHMIEKKETLEVQELQPLMENCLWMFGPEFDSIEYISNQTMATAVSKLLKKYKKNVKCSQNRPDFLIIPDGSISFYSLDSYDDDHAESGIDRLVIIELKAPSVSLGLDEQNQPRKYANELLATGIISEATTVISYVLGSKINKNTNIRPLSQGNHTVYTMLYNTLLKRAESRLFKLRDKIKTAPFMNPSLLKSK